MLVIKDLHVSLVAEEKEILSGVNLKVKPGEVHYLIGANGSGKSTLARSIMADPELEITSGEIALAGEEYEPVLLEKVFKGKQPEDLGRISLNNLDASQRSLLGIFLANQSPLTVPGVNFSHFLRLAYNARRREETPVFKFRELLKEKAKLINFPEELLDRNLNEGLSGGERKKAEVLQLAVLEPKYAVLDETDSGLDQQAIADVFAGIGKLREALPEMALLVISHYEKVQEYLKPDFTHEMKAGTLL